MNKLKVYTLIALAFIAIISLTSFYNLQADKRLPLLYGVAIASFVMNWMLLRIFKEALKSLKK